MKKVTQSHDFFFTSDNIVIQRKVFNEIEMFIITTKLTLQRWYLNTSSITINLY